MGVFWFPGVVHQNGPKFVSRRARRERKGGRGGGSLPRERRVDGRGRIPTPSYRGTHPLGYSRFRCIHAAHQRKATKGKGQKLPERVRGAAGWSGDRCWSRPTYIHIRTEGGWGKEKIHNRTGGCLVWKALPGPIRLVKKKKCYLRFQAISYVFLDRGDSETKIQVSFSEPFVEVLAIWQDTFRLVALERPTQRPKRSIRFWSWAASFVYVFCIDLSFWHGAAVCCCCNSYHK